LFRLFSLFGAARFGVGPFLSNKRIHSYHKSDSARRIVSGMRRRSLEFSDAFAAVLQRQREAQQLSRQALAQKAGLHQTYIGMIERGLSNPSLDAANALAEALEIPFAKLIAEAEKERNASQ
jgi:ribosome-binding protein aMBF1 (putative translation factor)